VRCGKIELSLWQNAGFRHERLSKHWEGHVGGAGSKWPDVVYRKGALAKGAIDRGRVAARNA
jgi:hypothetical protein